MKMVLEQKLETEEKKSKLEQRMQEMAIAAFDELVHQFKRPEQYIRELIQNSLDANPKQIDISYIYNTENNTVKIVVEDDGYGMSKKDIDKFLLKLFESEKEHDDTKIGRFGIGFVSVFKIKPDEVLVETKKDRNSYKVEFFQKDFELSSGSHKPVWASRIYNVKKNKKGTRVTITKKVFDVKEFNNLMYLAENAIKNSCAYAEVPIYFEEILEGDEKQYSEFQNKPKSKRRKLNREFDIDAQCRVRFGEKGVEGIIALGVGNKYELLNNRLLIEDGHNLFPVVKDGKDVYSLPCQSQLSFLINSRHLKYNLSRDDIIRDKHYEHILKLIAKQEDRLAEAVFSELEKLSLKENIPKNKKAENYGGSYTYTPGKDTYNQPKKPTAKETKEALQEEYRVLLWGYAMAYIKRKKEKLESMEKGKVLKFFNGKKISLEPILPGRVLDSNIFNTITNERISLRRVLEETEETDGELYYEQSQNKLTKTLLEDGRLVIQNHEDGFYRNEKPSERNFLDLVGRLCKVTTHFYMPARISYSKLNETEQKFLDHLNKSLKKSPLSRYYSAISFGDFSTEVREIKERPFVEDSVNLKGRVGYGKRNLNKDETKTNFFEHLLNKKRLLLNKNHKYIASLIKLINTSKENLAYCSILQTIASEEGQGYSQQLPYEMFEYVSQYLDSEEVSDYRPLKESKIKNYMTIMERAFLFIMLFPDHKGENAS